MFYTKFVNLSLDFYKVGNRFYSGFFASLINVLIMLGSSSVDVSPKLSSSLAAILRKIRRITLPDLVLGRLSVI